MPIVSQRSDHQHLFWISPQLKCLMLSTNAHEKEIPALDILQYFLMTFPNLFALLFQKHNFSITLHFSISTPPELIEKSRRRNQYCNLTPAKGQWKCILDVNLTNHQRDLLIHPAIHIMIDCQLYCKPISFIITNLSKQVY